jgi:hypothetical protein
VKLVKRGDFTQVSERFRNQFVTLTAKHFNDMGVRVLGFELPDQSFRALSGHECAVTSYREPDCTIRIAAVVILVHAA